MNAGHLFVTEQCDFQMIWVLLLFCVKQIQYDILCVKYRNVDKPYNLLIYIPPTAGE